MGEAVGSGLSESGMAKQLESAIQQKWGRGWNIVVSKTEMQVAANVNDIMAKFKARAFSAARRIHRTGRQVARVSGTGDSPGRWMLTGTTCVCRGRGQRVRG